MTEPNSYVYLRYAFASTDVRSAALKSNPRKAFGSKHAYVYFDVCNALDLKGFKCVA